jgi:hypothetical protein
VTSGPSSGDSMSQMQALRERPVRCGACSVCGRYRTAATSISSTGVIARGVEFDPPMPLALVNQPSSPNTPRSVWLDLKERNGNGAGGHDKEIEWCQPTASKTTMTMPAEKKRIVVGSSAINSVLTCSAAGLTLNIGRII